MFKKKSLYRIFNAVVISSLTLTPQTNALFSSLSSNPEKKLETAKENLEASKENMNTTMEKCGNFYNTASDNISKLEQAIKNLKKSNEDSKEAFLSLDKAFKAWLAVGCSVESNLYNEYLEARNSFNSSLETFNEAIKNINEFIKELNDLSNKPQYPYMDYKENISSLTNSYYTYVKASAELIK